MYSDLYDHPALYDVLLPVGAHLPYYLELAQRASGGVLELACGTGSLTVPIASAGLSVAGLDLSQPMLNAARERAAVGMFPLPEGRTRGFCGWSFEAFFRKNCPCCSPREVITSRAGWGMCTKHRFIPAAGARCVCEVAG